MLLFLRDWRTTFIASLAIPTSLIGTFAFMDVMGFTLNNFTMLGLILAVGIVIDDAVVVLENIFRHMEEKGLTARQAASSATGEIAPGGARDDAFAGRDLRPDRVYGRTGGAVLQRVRLGGRLLRVDEHVRVVHDDAGAVCAVS